MSGEPCPAALTGTDHHPSLSGKRIMLLEGDGRLYGSIKDTLEDFGCEILGSCVRTSSAPHMFPGRDLDAALIDLERLSVERSTAIVSGLRERGIPVVLITYLTSETLPQALQECARLLKPFTVQQMLGGLANVLGGNGAGNAAVAAVTSGA
jgi:hypothetical protein